MGKGTKITASEQEVGKLLENSVKYERCHFTEQKPAYVFFQKTVSHIHPSLGVPSKRQLGLASVAVEPGGHESKEQDLQTGGHGEGKKEGTRSNSIWEPRRRQDWVGREAAVRMEGLHLDTKGNPSLGLHVSSGPPETGGACRVASPRSRSQGCCVGRREGGEGSGCPCVGLPARGGKKERCL